MYNTDIEFSILMFHIQTHKETRAQRKDEMMTTFWLTKEKTKPSQHNGYHGTTKAVSAWV